MTRMVANDGLGKTSLAFNIRVNSRDSRGPASEIWIEIYVGNRETSGLTPV
jgi:hypothetical protein